MALFRGKLFAGALFAGRLFGVREIVAQIYRVFPNVRVYMVVPQHVVRTADIKIVVRTRR